MTLTIIEYGGTPRKIECESFEFRTNRTANLITIKKPDGTKTIIKDISVIKADDFKPDKIASAIVKEVTSENPK